MAFGQNTIPLDSIINTNTILTFLILTFTLTNTSSAHCDCSLPTCCCQLVQHDGYAFSGSDVISGPNIYATAEATCLSDVNCVGIHKRDGEQIYSVMASGLFTDNHNTYTGWILTTDCPTTTISPDTTATQQSCEDRQLITHFNWNDLMQNTNNKTIPYFNYSLSFNKNTLQLGINVELEYLGYTIGEKQAHIGTTYVLDFESFEGDNSNSINIPGNCENRNQIDFNGKTWDEYWSYSDMPYLPQNIGSVNYLAYPPNTNYWHLTNDNNNQCSRIHYSGMFEWTDLNECTTAGGTRHLITKHIDHNWINLTGTFYVSIVSPISSIGDIGFYRIYQLMSSPFAISISKSSSIISSTGINLFTMSLVAVYKEDNINNPTEDDFKLIVLSESADYLYLSNPKLMLTPKISTAEFIINNNAYSGHECIISTHTAICTQLWEIYALNVECPPNSFSGTYSIQWNATCDNINSLTIENETNPCLEYINTYGNKVLLSADLIWSDDICDDKVWIIQFEGNMNFYIDTLFVEPQNDYLYVIGEDRVYVEIIINYPSSTYSVFQSSLTNVWLCSIHPDIDRNSNDELVFISQDLSNLGCLDEQNIDNDGPYWIIQNYNEQFLHKSTHHSVSDGSSNKVRFSFIVPDTIIRDTIYVHAQITLSLIENNNNRRILLDVGGIKPNKPNKLSNPNMKQFEENENNIENMDQIRHFGGSSGVKKMAKILFGDEELRKEWNKNYLIVTCSVFVILMIMGFIGFKIHKSDPINWERIGNLIEMRRLRRLERLRIIGNDRGRIWYAPVKHNDSESGVAIDIRDDSQLDDNDLLMSHDDGCSDHY